MQPKKNPKADLNQDRNLYFVIGLSLVLGITWGAIEYKSYEKAFDLSNIDMLEDDEEDIIFGTNPFFKLLSLILVDMHVIGTSWSQLSQDFDRALDWRSVVDEKHKHIEDGEDLWNEIKDEIGEDYSNIIIPMLNRASNPAAMDAKL